MHYEHLAREYILLKVDVALKFCGILELQKLV